MDFKELLFRARENDALSLEEFAAIYEPLLIKEAAVNGVFDEDLYQELYLALINCIRKMDI